MSHHKTELVYEREEIEFRAKALSRRFSEEVAMILPENEVAQAMSRTTAQSQIEGEEQIWEKLMKIGEEGTAFVFSGFKNIQWIASLMQVSRLPNTSRELKIATKAVVMAWKELYEVLPASEKGSLKRSRFEWPNLYKSGKQNNEADEDESKLSKVSRTCQSLCKTLESHSDLFKIIPTSNAYVQIVTGVLTTIVTATINHSKIGAGFHKTIKIINREMEYCAATLFKLRESSEEARQEMRLIIANVFLQIFNFLIPYAKWCKSGFHRFSKSLDKNYYTDFVAGPRDDILAETGHLQRHTVLQTAQGVSKIDQRLAVLEGYIHENLSEKLGRRQQMSSLGTTPEELKRYFQQHLGQLANNHTQYMAEVKLLQDSHEKLWKDSQKSLHAQNLWTVALKSRKAMAISKQSAEDIQQTIPWAEVEKASRHLEAIVDNGYPLDLLTTLGDMKISTDLLHHIQSWLSENDSQLLWLCGPASIAGTSQVSVAAAYVVTVCERIKLPLIAYRFRADEFGLPEPGNRTTARDRRSIQMNRLVLMMQSIIRQLIWILPDTIEIENSADLSFERFYNLDARTESLIDMFNLLEELIALLPSKQLLVIVLDGFELVDNDTVDGTAAYLEEFLDIIRKAERERVKKVLISSDGLCRTLLNEDIVPIEKQVHLSGNAEEHQVADDEFWMFAGDSFV